MELEQARKRAEELRVIIEKNNRLYYDQDAPELEDFEYDALNRELKQIEAEYPELVTASSPTQHVGGTASSKFSKVTHAVKMESLQDAFSFDELREFDTRVREAGIRPEYVVEAKIDGLSVSLEYRLGQLERGSTRGDGVVGEDVTENIMTIKDIPHELPDAPDFLEVRGEVYMPHSAFFKLKEQQELEDKTPFKNPRNAAAGSLRQKDSKITAGRGLSIFVFNLQQCEGRTFRTHRETLDYIKSLGFPVSPRYSVFENIEDAIKEIEAIGEARGTLEFDIDGAVIKVNDLAARRTLIHWQCEVKKRWTSTTASWKACRPHCAHRWPSWMPTMHRTFRRSVCGWASPYSSRFAADCAPQPNFCPERVCLPRWRPTPCGTAFCSSAAARSTPMRTS